MHDGDKHQTMFTTNHQPTALFAARASIQSTFRRRTPPVEHRSQEQRQDTTVQRCALRTTRETHKIKDFKKIFFSSKILFFLPENELYMN